MKPALIAALGAVLLSGARAVQARAQLPPPSQAQAALQQALQQQPALGEVLRARIRRSGLTPEQIRGRLQASGYPTTLLDAFMGDSLSAVTPVPGSQQLSAIEALGLPPVTFPTGPLDTGVVQVARRPPSAVFGVDVFQRTTTQFLPMLEGPVPADYKLGPGDNLVLILTGDVELAYPLQVTREGFILIPQVGQVHTANLTLDQLRDVLYDRLSRVYSGVRRVNPTTRFDVTVTGVRANQVYVVGEVTQPGAYQQSSLGTVLTALYAAGGVTEQANLRRIQVLRLGKTLSSLDLYDYLLAGDTRGDIRLESGDVVFVPLHGTRARIEGAVVRPAIYEVEAGETLADLIRDAGGLRPDAASERITVRRVLPAAERGTQATAYAAISVPLVGGAPPPFVLQDGDSVQVDLLADAADQYVVTITGMVQQAGRFPWRPGMTLRELMVLARGPRIGADLREAEIARLPADRSGGQLATTLRVPLDSTYLFTRDSAGRYLGPPGVPFPARGSAAEVQLQAYDNVLILAQPDFELQRTVTIEGEVQFPGTYALRTKDERLIDLIRRVGGLTARAYPEGIRFVRPEAGAGRINIDLPRALLNPGSHDNVILQPGDSITIPEYQPSVRVAGAVNSPGSVLYRRGAGLDYYLSAAGGFTRLAEKGQVSVRQADGEVRTRHKTLLFFRSDPSPGPGSEVLVPSRDPNEVRTSLGSWLGPLAQVLASLTAIIIVATR